MFLFARRRPWFTCLVVGLLAATGFLSGALGEAAEDPARIPQRIVLSCAADPAHAMTATWRTTEPLNTPCAEIVVMNPAPDFDKRADAVEATHIPVDLGNNQKAFHYQVRFEDLKPATEYCYRVGDGATWSEWNTFRTAAAKPEPFRFLYFGDEQNDIRSKCARVFRTACRYAPDARFLLHAGDLVTEGWDDALWSEWCAALGFISAAIPSIATPGNHDMHRASSESCSDQARRASPQYHAHLAMPLNGPEGIEPLQGEAFYVDYQGVRIISINANAYVNDDSESELHQRVADAQLLWLDQVLANNPNHWTIVTHHQPIYSAGKDRDNKALREALVPLYDKYHVDLVLQGHDHHYARSQRLVDSHPVNADQPGTTYVVSVCGSKMYPKNPMFESLMVTMVGELQMFQVITVDGDTLTLDAYSVDGKKIDSFDLKKPAAHRQQG